MLALALSVTVGLLVGPAEAAKKKGKKGGTVSVSRTAPTAIPLENATTGVDGVASVPLTVGNKAKGKVVGADTATVATSWSGGAGFGATTIAQLIAPNGRAVGLFAPAADPNATGSGPTTETPNSPFGFCVPAAVPPPPPCSDPDNNLGPPYAGTIGNTAWRSSVASPRRARGGSGSGTPAAPFRPL